MVKIGFKTLVICMTVLLVTLPTGAVAFDAKLSGQISQMIMYAEDGDESATLVGDNANSPSRIRIDAKENKGDISIGGVIEIAGMKNSSASMTLEQDNDGDFVWKERIIEAYASGTFGTVSIGQGDGAANGTSEEDLSGTMLSIFPAVRATAYSLRWKNSNGDYYRITGTDANGDPIGLTVGDTRNNFDGLDRNERIRYDSPTFSGIYFSASVTNGSAFELAARYAGKFHGDLRAALGYVSSQDRETDDFDQIGASISWLSPTGLNITLATGQRDYSGSGTDPVNYYAKVGYKFGTHALAVEYAITQDMYAPGDNSSNIGAAYETVPWQNVTLFAATRLFMLDANGADPEPILQIYGGTRIRF